MILGHKHLIADFKKMADETLFGHGYIFFGQEGVGKFLTARALANYLETKNFVWSDGALSDVLVIEPDEKSSIGIDKTREISGYLYQRPIISKYRTVIVNNAETLTSEAQNSLLKISEEPPVAGLLILIVRDPELLRETLVSRFNKLFFSNLSINEVTDWLVKEYNISVVKAGGLARESFGRPGLALKLFKDEDYKELLKSAKKFLKLGDSERKDFLKNLTGEVAFNLEEFLDAVAVNIALSEKRSFDLWHRTLQLKKEASYFNLNPRVQLQALLESSK